MGGPQVLPITRLGKFGDENRTTPLSLGSNPELPKSCCSYSKSPLIFPFNFQGRIRSCPVSGHLLTYEFRASATLRSCGHRHTTRLPKQLPWKNRDLARIKGHLMRFRIPLRVVTQRRSISIGNPGNTSAWADCRLPRSMTWAACR
jgi:hypothetical protein